MKGSIRIVIICIVTLLIFTFYGCMSKSEKAKKDMKIAYKFLQEKNQIEAIAAFKDVILLEPKNIEARLELGKIYLADENFVAAESILEEALIKDVTNEEVKNLLISAYRGHSKRLKLIGIYSECELLLNKGLKLEPKNVELISELEDVYIQMERYTDAEKELREHIKIDSGQPEAYLKMADILIIFKRGSEAIDLLKSGVTATEDERIKKKLVELTMIPGNTPGNLQNMGICSIKDDWIYYSSFVEGLIKMRWDGSGKTILFNKYVTYLNVVGDWIYFVCEGSICKIKTDGSCYNILRDRALQHEYSNIVQAMGDYIYEIEDGMFVRWKIDGMEYETIEENNVMSFQVDKNWIYYYKFDTQELYRFKPEEIYKKVLVAKEPIFRFVISNEFVYYIRGGFGEMDSIYRMEINGTNKRRMNNDLPTSFNVSGDWIYYICNNVNRNGGEIFKMKLDGTERCSIYKDKSHILLDINIINDYVYYRTQLSNKLSLGRIKNDGSQNSSVH